ncbi:MAG: hypothetical protein DWQ37_05370 [Planctomycetota bacterium]|nr:MAG: hypothetical protein DWQ37_05370 [Planctomycetota bacterium]
MTASKVLEALFTGVDGYGHDDALLRLILLGIAAEAPSADVLTYLRALVGGVDDIGVSWIAERLNDAYDREAKGVR